MVLKECIVIYEKDLPVAIYGIRHFDSIGFLSFEAQCKENAAKLEQERQEKESALLTRIEELESAIKRLEHEIAVDRGEVE